MAPPPSPPLTPFFAVSPPRRFLVSSSPTSADRLAELGLQAAGRRHQLATQRVTIAKVGGMAAEVVVTRLREWASAREMVDPDEWFSDQWPSPVRVRADAFADRLRAHALTPPVIHFVEWVR